MGNRLANGRSPNLLGYRFDGKDYEGQGAYAMAYAISPTNAKKVFTGAVNTWSTSDISDEKMWKINTMWANDTDPNSDGYNPNGIQIVHADVHMIAYSPHNSTTMVQCNDGGIYISTDGGIKWKDKSNGLQISQFYRISSSTTGDLIMGGLQDNGTKLLDSNGWFDILDGDGTECIVDHTNNNIGYATTQHGRVFRSTDGFHNDYVQISKNVGEVQPEGVWITPLIIDKNDPMTLFAGYDEIYKSTDRGTTWNAISNINQGASFEQLAISPSNSSIIYASDNIELYVTLNDGKNWRIISPGLPIDEINLTSIATHPTKDQNVWVTFSGYKSGNKVFFHRIMGQSGKIFLVTYRICP